MEDSEAFRDVCEVACTWMGMVCAAAIDDGTEAQVGGRWWRPGLGGKERFARGVEVCEGRLWEAELILGERLDVEAVKAVLKEPIGISHEVEQWVLESEVVACLVDERVADGVLVAEMLESARGCCVGLVAGVVVGCGDVELLLQRVGASCLLQRGWKADARRS